MKFRGRTLPLKVIICRLLKGSFFMRHITINQYGTFLGITSERLIIKQKDEVIKELPLSRIRTISITKKGISLSVDLIHACAIRGIRIFFLDWKDRIISAVMGQNQHAVVSLRKAQFEAIKNEFLSCELSKKIIITKIKNQHAVIMYFTKNTVKNSPFYQSIINNYNYIINNIKTIIQKLIPQNDSDSSWKNKLMGLEGKAATEYWHTLIKLNLLPDDFTNRETRFTESITNKALNYGYAILLSKIWAAIDNTGMESYAGLLHTDRPGKPSLVLDLMEEYRAWLVDRTIIKLRNQIGDCKTLDMNLKKIINDEIHKTLITKYTFNKKRIKLENIIQRQAYRFAGALTGKKKYKGYSFKW